jgi:hypothetical protein
MLTLEEMEHEFLCSFDDASTYSEVVVDIGETLLGQCQVELLGSNGGEALFITLVHMSKSMFGTLYPFDQVLSVTTSADQKAGEQQRRHEEKTYAEPNEMKEVMMMMAKNTTMGELQHQRRCLTLTVRRWTKMRRREEESEERNHWYVLDQRTNVTEMLRQTITFRSQTATMDATEDTHKARDEKEDEGCGREEMTNVNPLPTPADSRGTTFRYFSGIPFRRMTCMKDLNMGAISRVMFEHVHPVGIL